ncbi:MAG: glycosyltransferase, partial [Acidimicrobiales bacterium]
MLWLIKGLGPGGAEHLLVNLASAHDRRRVALEVAYLLPWKSALVPDLEAAGVRVHCLDAADPRRPAWVLRLRRLLATDLYDVVHAHSPLVAGAARLVTRTIPARRRPAVVTTEHNAWSTLRAPTRLLNGFTAGLDDATIAVSEEARDAMWPAAVRRSTTVVVHGVAVDRIAAARAHRDETRD